MIHQLVFMMVGVDHVIQIKNLHDQQLLLQNKPHPTIMEIAVEPYLVLLEYIIHM